ncbi:MAG TPA: hypothetical protein VFV08_05195 [Puia sp.]|nr:hypothetical protein [Puia sp.]
MKMIRKILIATLLLSFRFISYSQSSNDWDKLGALKGEWIGEGSGQPGQGEGAFTFDYSLDKKIMVRKNHSSYPASGTKPAVSHDDLMVIYSSSKSGPLQSIYFDNEGHVINYAIHIIEDNKSIQFVSNPQANQPGFRLTYQFTDMDHVQIVFEISPDGKADHFKTYLKGSALKKK